MYGGSSKLGRGGGGGGRGTKRIHNPFPPPPPNRPAGAAGGRLTIGGAGSRNRQASTTPAAAPSAPEETFSLVTESPLAFAMIIRLTPDIVDEIKRVESQGGTARIKFDSNTNNMSGNVIDVGGKEFRFTWSQEPANLCDIYEERQGGGDGNGLLVESGCSWRKLNVQRILDESTKNHVKMRSEEAERKLRSRKSIVLDHGNPSVKNEMKTLAAAAVDVNSRWMPFKSKKEPAFKKRKVESTQVAMGGPPKSVFKPGLSSTATAKGRPSVSPVPSPPEQFAASTSPLRSGNLTKGHTSIEGAITPVMSKENASNNEREITRKAVHGATREASGSKVSLGDKPMDLQNTLITLLMENPKGMTLKALEKAFGDTIPNAARKIDPILKRIATFQAPGRYLLKQGVDFETFKKPSSESGSSPECTHSPDPDFPDKSGTKEPEQQSQLIPKIESNLVEKIDIPQNSPDLFGDKKLSDNSEGQAGSSSDSGSDSDSESDSSDSSDSGSQSRSRSKSRSPGGSGSGSSSDSESDGSSSSKEGSDVDVDIMTSDDDKEVEHKLPTHEPMFPTSPIQAGTSSLPGENGIVEAKQDGNMSDEDITIDDHENEIIEITDPVPSKVEPGSLEETIPFPVSRDKKQETQQFSHYVHHDDEREGAMKDDLGNEQSDSSERISKVKSKRGSDTKNFHEKSETAGRAKAGGSSQPPISMRNKETVFSGSPNDSSPDRFSQAPYKDQAVRTTERVGRDGNLDTRSQKGYNQTTGRSVVDIQKPGQRSADLSARGKTPDMSDKPSRYVENLGRGAKLSEKSSAFADESEVSVMGSMRPHGISPISKDKVHRETQGGDSYAYEKSQTKGGKESGYGDKAPMLSDSHYRRHGEQIRKFKDGHMAYSQMDSSPKDNNRSDADKSPVVNGKSNMLRREYSDLELGELREPIPGEEAKGVKKQFERKGSFKLSDSKQNASDNWTSDSSKGRTAAKAIQESRKQSPPNMRANVFNNQDSSSRKRTPEDDIESMRPHQKVVPSQAQQFSRVNADDSEVGLQFSKTVDMGSKSRKNETPTNQVIGVEGYGSTNKKAPISVSQQRDGKGAGQTLARDIVKETKSQRSNAASDITERRKDDFWLGTNNSHRRRESSSDEDSCSYSKYEKDEPELRGPIKDFSQYKEYVQEYREKYGTYCSLNKSLEAYRNDFQKLGHDLELARGRDVEGYYNILEQLREMYRQCGMRHKQLKKIFIVLHEELNHLKQRIKDYADAYTKD
ncbi:PREDICTED: dentin sialophosphoprotein [Nelumbo nucifera]|uniref:Dentin sialophosphoprotein n=1 Tax=Nelumbo nucifera TaxID=4432 RepID=A0A1U8BDA5_NELNU|nr:PREDICTED: dentin sialophosphoprotein [Nelumbo nucifera]